MVLSSPGPGAAEAGALAALLADIRACRHCAADLPAGPRPVVRAGARARLCIIGQAPGRRVHASGIPWDDASGARLRDWLQLEPDLFYDTGRIAIMPMGFCYPGVLPRGGDRPPRPECAPLWHQKLRDALPGLALTLLVGHHALRAYMPAYRSMTESVRDWRSAPPGLFPLPHPSWRTRGWEKQHPWFAARLLPDLRRQVHDIVHGRDSAHGRDSVHGQTSLARCGGGGNAGADG